MTTIWEIAKAHNTLCRTPSSARDNIDELFEQVQRHLPLDLDTSYLMTLLDDTMHFKLWHKVKCPSSVPSPYVIVQRFAKKTPLQVLCRQFKTALVDHHPVLCELATHILLQGQWANKWTAKMKQLFKQTIHVAYIYEALTRYAEAHSPFLTQLVHYYYTVKWTHRKPLVDFMNPTGGGFSFVKSESVMFAFDRYYQMAVIHKQKNIHKRNKAHILQNLGKEIRLCLDTNVCEAIMADRYINTTISKQNAKAAMDGLIAHDYGIGHYKDDTVVFPNMTRLYTSLYTSWNLCFIFPYQSAPLLYPKLLFPFLLGAPPRLFIFRRSISLWIAINSWLCSYLCKKPPLSAFPVPELHPMLARLNMLYAKDIKRLQTPPKHRVRPLAVVKRILKTVKNIHTLVEARPFQHYTSKKKYAPAKMSTIYTKYLLQ